MRTIVDVTLYHTENPSPPAPDHARREAVTHSSDGAPPSSIGAHPPRGKAERRVAERPRIARLRDRVARRVKSDDTTVYNADEDYGESQHVVCMFSTFRRARVRDRVARRV